MSPHIAVPGRPLGQRGGLAVEQGQGYRGGLASLGVAGDGPQADLDGFVSFVVEITVNVDFEAGGTGAGRYGYAFDRAGSGHFGALTAQRNRIVATVAGGSGQVQRCGNRSGRGRIKLHCERDLRVAGFFDPRFPGYFQRQPCSRRRRGCGRLTASTPTPTATATERQEAEQGG